MSVTPSSAHRHHPRDTISEVIATSVEQVPTPCLSPSSSSTSLLRSTSRDAPELHQLCLDGWPGGIESARMLEGLVLGKRIECAFRGRDRYGRSIGLCRADGSDLGAAHGGSRNGVGLHPV
jgi:endonuclease YncB( thermonuclease family)